MPERGSRLNGTVGILAACTLYVLAYMHGHLRGASACNCRSSPLTGGQLANEEELLSLVPHNERAMVGCLLQRPRTRTALRRRMYTCLKDNGLVAASWPTLPPALPPLWIASAPYSASNLRAVALPAASVEKPGGPGVASRLLISSDEVAPASVQPDLTAEPQKLERQEKDPLLRDLATARAVEEELPSAPTERPSARGGAGVPPDVASAATSAGRLVLITCAANGHFFTLEPGKDWVQCAGEIGGTPLHQGLWEPQALSHEQIAFKHVLTGHYLQVVPPGERDAWVVRAHSGRVRDPEKFEIREGNGEHVYLYNVGAACHINHRFGFVIRGHGKKAGAPAGRVPSARLVLRYYNANQLRTEYAEAAAREMANRKPISDQLARIRGMAASNEVRVISYGLYGADPRYTIGVLRNAQLAPIVYPGWKVLPLPRPAPSQPS